MTAQQAYYTLFELLDMVYNRTKNGALGQLLSDMNPYLFENSTSADPAAFEDFCNIWQQSVFGSDATVQQAKDVAQAYILHYEQLLNCHFPDARNAITTNWDSAAQHNLPK